MWWNCSSSKQSTTILILRFCHIELTDLEIDATWWQKDGRKFDKWWVAHFLRDLSIERAAIVFQPGKRQTLAQDGTLWFSYSQKLLWRSKVPVARKNRAAVPYFPHGRKNRLPFLPLCCGLSSVSVFPRSNRKAPSNSSAKQQKRRTPSRQSEHFPATALLV